MIESINVAFLGGIGTGIVPKIKENTKKICLSSENILSSIDLVRV